MDESEYAHDNAQMASCTKSAARAGNWASGRDRRWCVALRWHLIGAPPPQERRQHGRRCRENAVQAVAEAGPQTLPF